MIIGLMLRRAFGGGSEQLISGTDELALPGMNDGKVVQEWHGIVVSPSYTLPLRGAILSQDLSNAVTLIAQTRVNVTAFYSRQFSLTLSKLSNPRYAFFFSIFLPISPCAHPTKSMIG